jgi:hypothetical protein
MFKHSRKHFFHPEQFQFIFYVLTPRNAARYSNKVSKKHVDSNFKPEDGSNGYLLTPWSRFLLEKLTVNFAAGQEIPRIYGTRKFLTVHTSAPPPVLTAA